MSHKCCAHKAPTTCCMKHTISATDSTGCKHHAMYPAVAKPDSGSCKHHSMSSVVAKTDSGSCKHMQIAAPCGGMRAMGYHRHHHVNLFMAAISFLLLSIVLLMISKRCCKCKDCHCETKEEKKE